MIIIKTVHFEHKYEGDINIQIDNISVRIDWYIGEMPPQDPDELCTWRSNGFEMFWIEDVVSIRGENGDERDS